jgi:hypothetical protein
MRECWIWEEKEPFDKRSAWIDLLLSANHADKKTLINNNLTDVKRGSFITSEVKLSERWKWDRGKVRRFLKLLESDNMLKKEATSRLYITVIIMNYDTYQSATSESIENTKVEDNDTTSNEQVTNMSDTSDEQVTNINKNDKNDKNDKEIIIMTASEEKFISILKTIENYPIDMQKDKDLFNTLSERYPTLDLIQAIKDWSVYKEDAPLKPKCNARSQINTSFKKYVEWGRCIKNNSSISHKVNVRKTAAIINEPDSKYVDYQ